VCKDLKLTLQVMAGDTIEISAKAFYNIDNKLPGANVNVVPIIGSFLSAMTNPVNIPVGESSRLANDLGAVAGNSTMLSQQPEKNKQDNTVQPKSGINFVLYSSSFDIVEENTGYLPVNDNINAIQVLATDKLVMTQAGFFEIFVNNESKTPVYYDNLMVTMSAGYVSEVNAYYPFGMIIPDLSTPVITGGEYNAYKFSAKELQKELGLNWHDFGARMQDPIVGRWWAPDPMAEMYYHISPYVYANNNPILFVDPDGLTPRMYIETKGFGHAFVTVGAGDNTTVYTYGRYAELGKNKSFARSSTPTGEGVLIRLTGDDAKTFIHDQITKKEAVAFEFTKSSDDAVAKYFDNKFNSSNNVPTTGKYAGNENARVVDNYNIFTNNCVTVSLEGLQNGVDKSIKVGKGTVAAKEALNLEAGNKESGIIKVHFEDIIKDLKLSK